MALTLRRGWLTWTLLGAALGLIVLVATTLVLLRPAYLSSYIEKELEKRLRVDVSVGQVAVTFKPRPALTVSDVVFTLRRDDRPAFVRAERVSTEIGPFSVLRGHVARVEVRGLQITVPPGRGGPRTPQSADRKLDTDIIVDRLDAYDATLTIERSEPGREPLVFAIHQLTLNDVGVDRDMPFTAVLTNPVPEGRVESTGTIGAWIPEDPTSIALSGAYTFKLVNLGSLPGIGGDLTSRGEYSGQLTRLTVHGTADTPDFSLDLGGRRLPLRAAFHAVVDGSDGSTVLESVDATLNDTRIAVTGAIDNLPGPARRHIELTAEIDAGRIEDLLELVVDADPALSGDVSMKAHVLLPPGEGRVRDRMAIDGTFSLPGTSFSDPAVRQKLAEFSRRSLAEQPSGKGSVQGRLAGRFSLASGILSLRALRFAVPGAEVRVQGTYALASERLDLSGDVRMEASLSKAAGGWKGALLKPFDWWFRRDGAGAVIPITISGNPAKPKVGVSLSRLIRRGN